MALIDFDAEPAFVHKGPPPSSLFSASGDIDQNPLMAEAELHRYWQDIVRESQTVQPQSGPNSRRQTPPHVARSNSLVRDRLKFAQTYNNLIHSGRYTAKLIGLEFSYRPAVEDLFKTRNSSLEQLQEKSSREIEGAINELGKTHTEATISSLSSRHCQDMERLMDNWNKSIEALKDSQKEDFCDKLQLLAKEHESDDRISDVMADLEKVSLLGSEEGADSASSASTAATVNQTQAPIKMEESFTINLGAQLKTAHNLRIMAVDSLYLCDTQRNSSAQVRTQTAMSLYSHNLSALVLLVDDQFNSYYGIQRDFAQLCNNLTELHFENFNNQIKYIQEKVMPSYAGRHNLELGDCYITRHSNLADVHAVFHLVTDDSLKNGEVNSRHPIMANLRNILRVAHMYDIKTISIPLLLVDEMNEEILTVNWCLKRAELVLKCVKGFLIEMASLSTGVEQGTIQFLVPRGISEDLFNSLASLIPEVFRLANSLNLKSATP